ncbi:glycosyltransferase [Paenibacillus aestuarii]|uniref:Glycosyltransferase n=1 Tax=Paenibacillus aestuarii TaxID=516965 RepID=A0ABW0K296_9BACL|nr:glycosyltransferase [Paenibacillus aestuarii]
MRRVLICTEASFPRGGATANYIEYLALALVSKGYCPIVIGQGSNYETDLCGDTYVYKNIIYFNFPQPSEFSRFKIKRFIDANLYSGKQIVSILKKMMITSDDYIVFYSSNCFTINAVLKYTTKMSAMATMCITEHLRKSQFENILMYWRYQYTFKHVIPKTKSVLPISRYLDSYYKEKGCRTLLLPIMANPYEYSLDVFKNRKTVRFIYSGADFTKDSFLTMLKSFMLLTTEEKKQVEFHLTGVKREKLLKYLGHQSKVLEDLDQVLTIHPWLEYDKLVELMKQMDYLFIAREINQTTIANFPSKVPELMCYGVIPLVSHVGDYTDIYLTDGKDSLIFDGCTPEVGVNALRRAMQLPQELRTQMRMNARKTAEEKFYYGVWAEKISNFIEEGVKEVMG